MADFWIQVGTESGMTGGDVNKTLTYACRAEAIKAKAGLF